MYNMPDTIKVSINEYLSKLDLLINDAELHFDIYEYVPDGCVTGGGDLLYYNTDDVILTEYPRCHQDLILSKAIEDKFIDNYDDPFNCKKVIGKYKDSCELIKNIPSLRTIYLETNGGKDISYVIRCWDIDYKFIVEDWYNNIYTSLIDKSINNPYVKPSYNYENLQKQVKIDNKLWKYIIPKWFEWKNKVEVDFKKYCWANNDIDVYNL